MVQYGGVLPGTPVQTFVGSNPPVVLENFNGGIRHPHIYLIFDILIRHRVVHPIYCDVIVELYCGGTMFSRFKAGGRQRQQ